METGNQDKKIGIAAYEFIGTAFIMYALMMERGIFGTLPIYVTFAMMLIAWKVSGGHFNPAITLGVFVAEKDAKNLVPMAIMIVSQFAGALFGILLGFLALIDKTYQENLADANNEKLKAKVPRGYVGQIGP